MIKALKFNRIFLLSFSLITLFLVGCKKDYFTIDKGSVGVINSETKEAELMSLFKKDSLVKLNLNKDLEVDVNNKETTYELFEKGGGAKLLEITAFTNDSISRIKNVQLFHEKYKTKESISIKSTFKDINSNYTISKVETTLTSAMLSIDEFNAVIVLDKEEIGISKFNMDKITVEQIPDNAKIKYFTIWFKE